MSKIYPLKLAAYLGIVLGCIYAADKTYQKIIYDNHALTLPTPIDSTATLYSKIAYLHDFNGRKIAVFGDSLVYGHAMLEHGNKNWKQDSITSKLSSLLSTKDEHHDTIVMNFGMNGIIPSDMSKLIKLAMTSKPDIVIFDVTLRSFSDDFNNNKHNERKWIHESSIDNGQLSTQNHTNTEQTINTFLINNSALFRTKEWAQNFIFGSSTKSAAINLRDSINKTYAPPGDQDTTDNLLLLLKARQRYSSINLNEGNEQWNAFADLLDFLQQQKQKTIIFYATENPDEIDELISQETHKSMISKISALVQPHHEFIHFIPPLNTLQSEHFLDHVHLTSTGYGILARRLEQEVYALK